MVPGTQKELFLKNLDTLFSGYRGIFNSRNTVIVDDTPLKHIMNMYENVVLPLGLHQECHGVVKLVMELHYVSQGGKQGEFGDDGASVWSITM